MRSSTTCQSSRVLRLRRSGIVIVAVMVAVSVCLSFAIVWARAVVREQRRMANHQNHVQAMRLAEAGIRRAIALHSAESTYLGETWEISKRELDTTHDGQVRIRVTPSEDHKSIHYEVTAEFPVGEIRHSQIMKSINLPNSQPVGKL